MKRSILAAALIVVIAATSMLVLAQARQTAKDPVCGLTVDKNPELSANHRGETFYFCTRADMEKFKKEPDRYGKKK